MYSSIFQPISFPGPNIESNVSQMPLFIIISRYKWKKIDFVMQLFDNKHYVYDDCKLISLKAGNPTSTLSDWRRKKMSDVILKAIFTDEEEKDITKYILDNIIKPGILLISKI